MAKSFYALGAVAAAAIAGGSALFAGQQENERHPVSLIGDVGDPTEPADLIKFCLPPSESSDRECITRKQLMARADQPMMRKRANGEEVEMSVMMGHPSDFQKPTEKIKDCKGFAKLKKKGWGGVSSVDMMEEEKFTHHCGLYKLAMRAKVEDDSAFTNGALTRENLEDINPASWPMFGEQDNRDRAQFTNQSEGIWIVEYGAMIAVLSEISHADFNKDGHGDILGFLLASPEDGTARFSAYVLIEDVDGVMAMNMLDPFKE